MTLCSGFGALAAVVLTGVLAGCGGSPYTGHEAPGDAFTLVGTPDALRPRPSGLRVGELIASGTLPADAFWLPIGQRVRFDRTTADGMVSVERRIQDVGGRPEVVLTDIETGEILGRTVLDRTPNGEVVILVNTTGKIRSAFEPPALLAPMELRAGDEIVRSFEVTTTGRAVTSGSGDGDVTIRCLGSQRVATHDGVFNAMVVESEMVFKINAATITLSQRSWISQPSEGPGGVPLGLVAVESGEKVTVFGLTVHSDARSSLLRAVLGD